ncbi:class I SAM-dependent methyltransferase [Adhaeribacter sp. BT258]|uniref:Class I SAM-dependent methyltransferase n=1 Tax=Adhaeribacter terrigena TaxID=2793070 RepID=A0ABS1C7U2_9BACT|nr:class I SAM-dependent methyltransferase [Adhaeribacter terrigena]MBK0404763.1 class I SAM-dependent methyltransferase [Adhaeribacter terrigena]
MFPIRLAAKYAQHLTRSFRLHGIHSPFVFNLQHQVIDHKGTFGAYLVIEDLRHILLEDNRKITIKDFGAGSRTNAGRTRKVKDIALHSAKAPKHAQLLFRLVNHFAPQTIFDLGTSLGLTTAYLASARRGSTVYTFEGCPETASLARENFKSLKLGNIQLAEGNLDETLSETLKKVDKVNFAFLDGNHRYEPTMRYFRQLLAKADENSVFVIDDIYWSAEMERAWKEIAALPEVTVALDLFQIGIVFFRKSQVKEYFTIRY